MAITAAAGMPGRTTDQQAAPFVVRRGRDRLPAALLLLVSSIWVAVAVRGLLAGDPQAMPGLGLWGACGALVVGAALALVALDRLCRVERIVIANGVVAVTIRQLARRTTWREPLANYPGLCRRREPRPHRYGARSWYAIDLWHPDPSKSIELARAKDAAGIAGPARILARDLGLPLLEAGGPGVPFCGGDVAPGDRLARRPPPQPGTEPRRSRPQAGHGP